MTDPITDLTTAETNMETIVSQLLSALQLLITVNQEMITKINTLTTELAAATNPTAVEAIVAKLNTLATSFASETSTVNAAVTAAQSVITPVVTP